MERNYIRLAEAIPAGKYTWRPGEGVRSVSEVLLHIAGANYNFPNMAGNALPAGVSLTNFEQSATEKAKVIEILKASFAHARQVVGKQTEADFVKPVKLFGRDTQVREIYLVMNHHMHEHMGQLIAYARVNGVVPPWTEERLQQQKQAPPKK
jgi:uncharacterized damage-inducible protein DinB